MARALNTFYRRVAMWIVSLTVLLAATSPAKAEPQPSESAVELLSPEGELHDEPGRRELHLRARVKSRFGLSQVEVGVLYAAEAATLSGITPGSAYREPPANVGMIRQTVLLRSTQPGIEDISFVAPASGRVAAKVFVYHVLNYRLAEPNVDVLLSLLATQSAADEAAAVGTFALADPPADRLAKRKAWQTHSELVGLCNAAVAEVPLRPSETETFARVFVIRALGVLAPPCAEASLKTLAAMPTLVRMNEPMQVLRVARLLGSALETPLAYALPVDVNTMPELVNAAERERQGLEELAAADAKAIAQSDAAAPQSPPASVPAPPSTMPPLYLLVGVLLVGVAVGLAVQKYRGSVKKT